MAREGLKVPQGMQKKRRFRGSEKDCVHRRAEQETHVSCWGFAFDRRASDSVLKWLLIVDVEKFHLEPGNPWENGYAESFHRRLQDEFLAMEAFERLAAAKKLTRHWQEYHNNRPHSSPGHAPPASSWIAVLPPLRSLRFLRSSSTPKLPSPYLHNSWYKISKLAIAIALCPLPLV